MVGLVARPATTILPSSWIATACAWSRLPKKSVTLRPPFPKERSRLPASAALACGASPAASALAIRAQQVSPASGRRFIGPAKQDSLPALLLFCFLTQSPLDLPVTCSPSTQRQTGGMSIRLPAIATDSE